ncbi:MAG: methylated-DNA--[protein]-cysteine S-methyltransferase [Phycisphaeraceae bacterium]
MISQNYNAPIGLLQLTARAGRLVGLRFGADLDIDFAPSFADPEDQAVLDRACRQLDGYFKGERRSFDVPIALQGTSFQLKVWAMLSRIPFGKMVSYGQMAEALGRGCPRSVGSANGANPLPIFLPCHRVIASDGSLGGFSGGLDVKQKLLDLEYAGSSLYAQAAG